MPWKPEHEAARKARETANPALREKRIQSAKESYQRRIAERKEYMKKYYAANPEKFPRRTPEQQEKYNAARRKKYAECEETRSVMKAAVKAWQEGNPAKRKESRLRQYGLDGAMFDAMMTKQNGKCAICGHSDITNPKIFPVVDHCHTTGKVRGLLCMACNQGIGKFKDDAELLIKAADYIASRG